MVKNQSDYFPNYFPGLDQAVSPTAQDLGSVVTGKTWVSSNSWIEQQAEVGEESVLAAVREARLRGLVITEHQINVASALMWALPSHIPMPDVVVEDDAEIAFDWNESSDRGLTVSVKGNGSLGYAALVGLRPDYGRAPFAGSIPCGFRKLWPVNSGNSGQLM